MQPGQTITPGGATQPPDTPESPQPPADAAAAPQPTVATEAAPAPLPTAPSPDTQAVMPPQEQPAGAPQPDAGWQYADEAQGPAGYAPEPDASVAWTASEYVAHQKGVSWYAGLGLLIAILAIGIFLLTHSIFSPAMIVIVGVAFGVFAARQPRVLEYAISRSGLKIGQKVYSFDNFKSFSIVEEGALHSILLTPLQRFMPPITMYFDPNDEDRIVDVLGDYLPFTAPPRDAVDSLMRRVRF